MVPDLYPMILHKYPYLQEEKLTEIMNLSEIIVLEVGEPLVKAGEMSNKVGLVLTGLMRNYTINDHGEEVTVMFAAEMEIIAPYKTLLGMPATESSAAVEQSLLLVIDFEDFKRRTQEDAIYMRLYVELIEALLVRAVERIEDFTQKKPEQRYQRVLDTQTYLIDRAPLKYLASYIGITPVSLSRIRKRMSRGGRETQK
jgi:CRP-like cAMP-binding protein